MATQTNTVNKKTIGVSALITLGLLVAGLIGQSYFDSPTKYYCEAKSSIIECPGGLSSGLGSRCYINTEKTSWSTCTAGWLEITNDLIIQDKPQNTDIINSENMGPSVCCSPGSECVKGKCEG